MPSIPEKMPEKGLGKEYARKINELLAYIRTLRPVPTINEQVEHTIHGTVRRPQAGGGSGDGIVPRWL